MLPKYSRAGVAMMAVPLYAGPVLAGLSGARWSQIFPFAAVFFLMQMLRGIDAKRGSMGHTAFLLVMGVTQILVVGIAFGLGHGLMLITGPLPMSQWAPFGLTVFGAAMGVARYKYDPDQDQLFDMADAATEAIETGFPVLDDHADDPQPNPAGHLACDTALSALWSLPEDAVLQDLDPIVQNLETAVGANGFHALMAEIDEGSPQVDLAFLRYLASPAVRHDATQTGELGFALSCLLESPHAGVRHELILTLLTLLDENAPPDAFPPADEVRSAVAHWPDLAPLAVRIAAVQT